MILRGAPLPAVRHATIMEALAAAARTPLGLTFLDAQEREAPLPFAELRARALRLAGALRAIGVERGDRVAIVLPTGVDFMDAFFGALLAGAVPVPLYPPVRLGRLEEFHARTARMIEVVSARVVLSDARVSKLLGVSLARARPPLGRRLVAELLDAQPHAPDGAGPDRASAGTEQAGPGDLALIQFSSGTTVDPKPVALTHANILSNVAAIDTFVPEDLGVPQAGVSWLPLYHDMGLIGCLLMAVAHPGPLTLLPPEVFLAKPALWLRAISRKRATISVAPNFAYGLCVKRIRDEELEGVDLSSWQLALNGAEPIAPAVLRRFAERFAKFGFDERALTPVYGLSEASLAVTFTPRRRGPRLGDAVSVGLPLPGVEVRVTDSRVFVRGPSVMRGYFGNDAATAVVLRDGWLDTGDLGFIEDGELYVSGRAKELVILRGKNFAPQEFEDALDALDGVRAGCAVAVGVPTDDGEELALLVEGDADPEAIRTRVLERTGIRAHRVEMLASGTLPRTSSGKLRRGEARRQLLQGELRPPDRVNAVTVVKEMARSWLAPLVERGPAK